MKFFFAVLLVIPHLAAKAQVFDITNFGAIGNGSTYNTAAIQAAVDSCSNSGGGIVRVPPGNFVTATIFLKSNVTFLIDSGATVTGAPNTTDYPDVIPLIRSYTDNYTQRSVFYAEGQSNITITGSGTFNGNGISGSFLLDSGNKPYGFRIISCRNVRYEELTMRNSGFWMMHNMDIDTLVIKNLYIVNQNFGNGDGVNIDGCREVIVDSIFADCNDDPLVIKTTSLIPSRNISISNCTVATYSRGIKLGTETHGPFENIHVNNITVQFSTLGPFGSNYAAKCGINLSVVDGGSMDNVLIENINMTGIKTPIMIRLGNRGRKYMSSAPTPGVGFLRNIELRNITATATTNITSSITGIPGYYASDIRLDNINLTFPGGWADVPPGFTVPENISGGPEATIFGDTLPASGLYVRHVDSLLMNNVCFHAIQADGRKVLVFDDVLNVDSSQVCNPTSVYKWGVNNSYSAFPNPVLDKLIVTGIKPGEIISVYDLSGRILFENLVLSNGEFIPLSSLTSGSYFLHIGNKIQRFIKL